VHFRVCNVAGPHVICASISIDDECFHVALLVAGVGRSLNRSSDFSAARLLSPAVPFTGTPEYEPVACGLDTAGPDVHLIRDTCEA
jgi:hypothetical protein